MGKRITKGSQLPDWFDTYKYEAAINLDARGWYEQIYVRHMCYMMIWSSEIPESLKLMKDSFYGFKQTDFLRAVRAKPIYDFFGSEFLESITRQIAGPHDTEEIKTTDPPGISGISPFDVGSLMLQLDQDRQKEFLHWLEVKRITFSSLENSECPIPQFPDWFGKPLEGGGFVAVKIDPILPDKVLRESFDLYLADKVTPSEPWFKSKPKRSNMFVEWCNCGLLQYVDLMLWSMETKTQITNKALATGIFPNNFEKGEENVRTTTKKHAKRLLKDDIETSLFMHTLAAYAQLEDYLANQ